MHKQNNMYQFLVKPILFLFDPEKVHHFTFSLIRTLCKIPFVSSIFRGIYSVNDKRLERTVFGLKFKNPVGLAAGFDKDAKLYNELSNFGFGFIEIGTLTPKPQVGNPKKRLFRLKQDEAIINRMGFNNGGVHEAVTRLKKNKGVLIGGNIGKNKITPNESAVEDYKICFEALFPHVDYFVVNVSSPNTPGLRDLQEKEPLTKLLKTLTQANAAKSIQRPILLKIAPDLTNSQLDDIVDIVKDTQIEGVIGTNTTIAREPLSTSKQKIEDIGNGGLSGKPLKNRATEVIKYLSQRLEKGKLIIGVGGISSANDAIEKIEAGASLVQIYSGLIYEGPNLVKKINKALIHYKSA